jgi:hypothetical protein
MKNQRIAESRISGMPIGERLTTSIIPIGADLVVGAIAASRFYSVRVARGGACCDGATVQAQPALPILTSAEV